MQEFTKIADFCHSAPMADSDSGLDNNVHTTLPNPLSSHKKDSAGPSFF